MTIENCKDCSNELTYLYDDPIVKFKRVFKVCVGCMLIWVIEQERPKTPREGKK